MEIASAKAQPVRAIQPPFDFHLRSPKARTDFFPWHAPAVGVPADGVIIGHFARDAHTQDFFQAVFSSQPPMGIVWVARQHLETVFPVRKEAHLQKVIRSWAGIDSCQAQFLRQTILERLEEPLDAALGLRTLRRDPFHPQFAESSPELRAASFSPELFG